MIELVPGWVVELEESTRNHWVGSCGNIALIFAYEGSHDDVRHVHAMARRVERLGKQSSNGVRLIFALPPLHSKPPDDNVRRELVTGMRRLAPLVSHTAIVVGGTGFGAALHRGVVTGIMAMARPSFRVKVEGSLRAGLGFLLDSESAVFEPLLRYCEDRALGPAAK
jgi:hypothetical protein